MTQITSLLLILHILTPSIGAMPPDTSLSLKDRCSCLVQQYPPSFPWPRG